jgi:hypothetical protein
MEEKFVFLALQVQLGDRIILLEKQGVVFIGLVTETDRLWLRLALLLFVRMAHSLEPRRGLDPTTNAPAGAAKSTRSVASTRDKPMKEFRIIGLYGSKGVGKDFVGSVIREVVEERPRSMAETMALADPIKQFAIDLLGIPYEQAYGSDEDKNTITSYSWASMPFKHDKKGQMTVREIIQAVGTELGRDVWGSEIWVNAMHKRIENLRESTSDSPVDVVYAIVTDLRFDNEVQAVRRWGGEIWGVKGPQRIKKIGDTHVSERQHEIPLDAVVINDVDTTREQIKTQIKENLAKWLSTTSTAP